ncbi:unnamed protein product [Coregonus sp. 'balchen']|nr:unnamed protein product [Coregonus sp. 'balchen']
MTPDHLSSSRSMAGHLSMQTVAQRMKPKPEQRALSTPQPLNTSSALAFENKPRRPAPRLSPSPLSPNMLQKQEKGSCPMGQSGSDKATTTQARNSIHQKYRDASALHQITGDSTASLRTLPIRVAELRCREMERE